MILTPSNSLATTPATPPMVPARPAAPPPSPAAPTERFISADTAQMLDNIERNHPGYVQPAPPAPAVREPISSDMAEMVDNIRRAEERDRQATIISAANLTGVKAQGTGAVPTQLVMLDDPPAPAPHHDDHNHHHEHLHHGFLGAHIGLEGGEAVAHGMASAKAEVAAAAAHMNGDVADGAVTAGHAAAHEVGGALAGAFSVGAAASGALGVAMLWFGGKEIRAGIKKKDLEHTLEGTNAAIVGTRSGLAAVSMAGAVAHSSALAAASHAAQLALAPLGVVHGAIDVGLGSKDIVMGVKKGDRNQVIKGSLGVGLGTSLAVAALGGGLPALGVAAVFLGAKIVHAVRSQKHGHDGGHAPDAAAHSAHPTPAPALEPHQAPNDSKAS